MLLPKDFFIQYLLSRALILRGALGKYSECPASSVYLWSCPNGPSNVPSMSPLMSPLCQSVSLSLLLCWQYLKGAAGRKPQAYQLIPAKRLCSRAVFSWGSLLFFLRKFRLGRRGSHQLFRRDLSFDSGSSVHWVC